MDSSSNGHVMPERDAARYLGMSVSWLRKSRMEGATTAPPFLKIGKAVRYARSDLDIWIAGRRRRSTTGRG